MAAIRMDRQAQREPRNAEQLGGCAAQPNGERRFVEREAAEEARRQPIALLRHADGAVRVEGFILGGDFGYGVKIIARQSDPRGADQQAGERDEDHGQECLAHDFRR